MGASCSDATGNGAHLGYAHAGLFSRVTYDFVEPLIRLGLSQKIEEHTSADYLPATDKAEKLAGDFESSYAVVQGKHPSAGPAALLWLTYLRLYRGRMVIHLLWTLAEVAVRVASPVFSRQLISWFVGNELYGNAEYPMGRGWMWAGLLGLMGYIYAVIHHQLFWIGMRMGFQMRVQAIAAVQAKVLRLNSVAVADVSPGKIVNMVSNDVRRFDDAGTFWVFLVCAPIELVVVLVLVGRKLGFPAAVSGVATLLLLIPTQGILVRYIGKLRANTAAQTDERVRLTSEAIDGVMAAKMMCWEDPIQDQILAIRKRETGFIRRMARIRAMNMALNYAITPLVSLITFGVARATGQELTVANIFYALALLSLPKLYMTDFFVKGVEFVSELRISIRRLGGFLQLPEPPAPLHAQHASSAAAAGSRGSETQESRSGQSDDGPAVSVSGVDFDWEDRSWVGALKKSETSTGLSAAPSPAAALTEPHGATSKKPQVTVASSDEIVVSAVVVPAQTVKLDARGTHPTLKCLDFQAYKGQLVAIVGEVGAGKSSVLAALLGELQPILRQDEESVSAQPSVVVQGRVAYCSQVPWIVSATVKENILFGMPYDEARYDAVLSACALRDDIAGLDAGDETELGERGINLSGGQKARLALARAAYSGADVQLLDDPLSAVDPRVGRILFQDCIGPSGVMAACTRLLVTHQRQYLPSCNMILVMEGGRIVERGTYAELEARGITQVIASHETELDDATYDGDSQHHKEREEVNEEPTLDDVPEDGTSDSESPKAGKRADWDEEGAATQTSPGLQSGGSKKDVEARHSLFAAASRKLGRMLGRSKKGTLQPSPTYLRRFLSTKLARRKLATDAVTDASASELPPPGKSGRLIVGEDRATGGVSMAVYGKYLGYMGYPAVVFIAACLLGGQAAYLNGDYWLARWSSKSPEEQQKAYWVWGYAIFAGSVAVVSIVRALLFFAISLKASTAIHNAMVERVLRAPLSFFHTNPTGRVLNRFSRDQGAVDDMLPQCLFDSLQALMMTLGAFVLLMVVVPFIIPVFLPLGIGFFWVRRRYLATSRDVKRFEAVTRSPVYSSLSAILKGLPTIRAYNAGPRFRDSFLHDLSHNGSWWFCFLIIARWLGFRLDMLVALLMTTAPILMMAVHSKLEPRLVGLALTQSLQLSGMLQWMVRQTAEVENHMTSVERMLHYTRLDQEPPTVAQGGGKPPKGWPSSGAVQYDNVTAIYRPGLPPVLKDLTFTLQGGVSCGVVGRTGSGKSSLMLTLFRLIPITDGHIYLDGVDASSLGLDALRRQIAIIPQDPVLFSGTLRSNLDPWNKFEDHRLWEVLKTVQLGAAAAGFGGLDSRMSEAGDNLSVGQRQLFCLARALLQEASVLALDEATANVDRTTDALIQQAVRNCTRAGEQRRTLLVIAHRIDTIMDCDQLLVLNRGQLVESGGPQQLVTNGGVFARLVEAAQEASRHHAHTEPQQ